MFLGKVGILFLSTAMAGLSVVVPKEMLTKQNREVCALPKEVVATSGVKVKPSLTEDLEANGTKRKVKVFDSSKNITGYEEVYSAKNTDTKGQVAATRDRFTVLIAVDEEYRELHSDWKQLTYRIVETADESFKREHNIDFDVEAFARWDSNGSNGSEMLEDLEDDWADYGFDFVVGFTADKDFEYGGLAYRYSSAPKGSAVSITEDKSTISSSYHTVQHELSHNFGLAHDSKDSGVKCIMNLEYFKEVDYWDAAHDAQIQRNKSWYGSNTVIADGQTDPVHSSGDAADDPAIWVHPTNPALSKIIGTDKKDGLVIYDLDGKEVNFQDIDKLNNIDVRYNFWLGNRYGDIAGASNRDEDTIDIYEIKNNGSQLDRIGHIQADIDNVYGFSFFHDLWTGKFYAIISGDGGKVSQFELYTSGNEVRGKLVRKFNFGDTVEGIVGDDEYGKIYIAEEEGSLWRLEGDPFKGNALVRVDNVDDSSYLEQDLEGLAIYYGRNGSGYLLMSSQGNDRYIVYDRKSNQYLGNFKIVDGNHTDGVTDTDGIDVISFGLGPKYPYGIFVAQDGENTAGNNELNQNFKIVSWERIAATFNFEITGNQVNPRYLVPRSF